MRIKEITVLSYTKSGKDVKGFPVFSYEPLEEKLKGRVAPGTDSEEFTDVRNNVDSTITVYIDKLVTGVKHQDKLLIEGEEFIVDGRPQAWEPMTSGYRTLTIIEAKRTES